MGVIGLLRAFFFACPVRGLGMSMGFTLRHAQMAGDLGFAKRHCNASKTL